MLLIVSLSWLPAPAHAASASVPIFNQLCYDSTAEQYNSPVCRDVRNNGDKNKLSGPTGVIQEAANLIAIFGGIIGVIVLVVSGFMFATAGGAPGGQRTGDNPNRARKARGTFIGALIGMTAIALGWVLVSFVVGHFVKS